MSAQQITAKWIKSRRWEKRIEATALNPDRKQPVQHPWNRGFPNNRALTEKLRAMED